MVYNEGVSPVDSMPDSMARSLRSSMTPGVSKPAVTEWRPLGVSRPSAGVAKPEIRLFKESCSIVTSVLSLLSENYITVFSLLSKNYITVLSLLSENYITVLSLLSENYITILSLLSENYITK